jgi:hypothetical protein
MEQQVFADENQFPTEEIIYSHIGKTKTLWISFFKYIHSEYPSLTEQWRYYKDGKSWLMKVLNKSKTIFWLSVVENSFKITFYFTDKVEPEIINSTISDELKAQFKNGKRFNKIRGLTIRFKNKNDIEYAKSLLKIKCS